MELLTYVLLIIIAILLFFLLKKERVLGINTEEKKDKRSIKKKMRIKNIEKLFITF